MASSVVVLGGGIIGLSCAYEASRRGFNVTLLEPGKLGGQASGAAAGMLAPYSENTDQPDSFFHLCRESLHLYPEWINEIERCSGISAEWSPSGSIGLLQHEADLLPAQSRIRWQNEWGAGAEIVEGSRLGLLEPALANRAFAAVYSPHECHVFAPALVAALEAACRRRGVVIYEQAGSLQEITVHGFSGATVRMERLEDAVSGDLAVFCSGAWSGQFERWLGIHIPVHPIRGQICSFPGGSEDIRHMVFSSQAYWVAKRNGQIVCGASEDVSGFVTDVTEKGINRLLRASDRWFPGLTSKGTACRWAGLRPATPDGLPLIGRVLGDPTIMMAAGHYRNGILLSPVTSKMVGDMLEGVDRGITPTLFSPDRFTLALA
ncbi:glycine oxidase ThiO [Paenibacillus sp. GCM10027627]|uniref:glycine oxidase ThiO n=1 Tax=unclassified Paenibacillus TaxID=185978 RepID=UPI00362ECABE